MKKTLLAAALMVGFAGVAQAETSVTLYGVVDGGIGYERMKGSTKGGSLYAREGDKVSTRDTRTGLLSGVQRGNRWGLRGSEDLGNGLRMIFQLESGFDIADGHSAQGGRLFGREAHFGLAGDSWGQLTFGRQTTITSMYVPAIGSPFGASFGQANFGATFSAANTVRYDNMIQYQTPSFSGFQAGLGYSFNTNGKQLGTVKRDGEKFKADQKAWTAAVRYANGPIGVAASYDQYKTAGATYNSSTNLSGLFSYVYDNLDINDPNLGLSDTAIDSYLQGWSKGNERVTVREWMLAGSYDFEVVKLHLAGGQARNGYFASQFGNTVAGKGSRVNNYTVGLSAPVGAGSVMASWAMSDLRKAPQGDFRNKADYKFKKQQVYSLGYTYPLSKRTNVYAVGSYAKNVNFAPDLKSTLVGVGLSHQF